MQIWENISRSWLAMFSYPWTSKNSSNSDWKVARDELSTILRCTLLCGENKPGWNMVRCILLCDIHKGHYQLWKHKMQKYSFHHANRFLALWYSQGPGEMFPPSVGCTFENSWDASCFVPLASWCKISLDEISRWSFEQMNCQNASCFLHLALWCRISLDEILRFHIFEQLKCQDEYIAFFISLCDAKSYSAILTFLTLLFKENFVFETKPTFFRLRRA